MAPNDPPKSRRTEYPLTYTDETRVEKINFTICEEKHLNCPPNSETISIKEQSSQQTTVPNGQEVDRQELSNEETSVTINCQMELLNQPYGTK